MHILVIEPGSSAIFISNSIRRLGYEPIILCSISEYSGDQRKYLLKNGYFEVNCREIKEIIDCIVSNNFSRIVGVLSTADRFIPQACEVASRLDVKGMDPALSVLNNKAKVTELVPEESPPGICFNRTLIPVEEIKALLKESSSLIFKPVQSAGAKGLFEISREEDLDNILTYMQKETQVNVIDQNWIVEPRIEGRLHSLEGYFLDGKLHVIGLSRRTRIDFTETQNLFPVELDIDSIVYEKIKNTVRKLAALSGYKNGYFHSEFIVQGSSTYLIDANFGRIGGGCIPENIAISAKKSIDQIYAHVIEVTLFSDKVQSNFYPKKLEKSKSILYGVNLQSTFQRLEISQPLKSRHTLFAEEGKLLRPIGADNRAIIGMLNGIEADIFEDIKKIHIHTSKGKMEPIY